MALSNTPTRFGGLTRLLHWLTALLILALFPLGFIANQLPYDSAEALARKAQLFSIHKTLGIATFAVALLRILWALVQPHRPGALHPERRAETFLAGLVHWLLYAALVVVPLTGWITHAASEGFAPIWWPLGQNLPLIPDSPALAETFGTLHEMAKSLLIVAIALHVAGALKHALIDRDGTLARMATGRDLPVPPQRGGHVVPAVTAFLLWSALLAAGSLAAPTEAEATAEAPAALQDSALTKNQTVTDGSIAISVRQMGSDVEGRFATWSAAIDFNPATGTGQTEVSIDIASLTLGSVTEQALGADFLDATGHPTARFAASLAPDPATSGAYVATGSLTLRGVEVPLTLPFTLTEAEDGATAMTGTLTLDRRDFAVGTGTMPDDSSLGFEVVVTIALTATPLGG